MDFHHFHQQFVLVAEVGIERPQRVPCCYAYPADGRLINAHPKKFLFSRVNK